MLLTSTSKKTQLEQLLLDLGLRVSLNC